jgi:hypothetical protein
MRREVRKPQAQNQRLEPTGLAKPGKSCGSTGRCEGLGLEDAAGWIVGQYRNGTEPFFRSGPGPLEGHPDPLLTLPTMNVSLFVL